MKVKKEDLQDFFSQYKTFLEIEATISFIKGRDYELIKLFYHLFLEISQGSSKVEIVKEMLDEKFCKYKDENKEYSSIQFVRGHEHIEPITIALERGRNIKRIVFVIEKASNHFKRGALDSYKAIIKDFCILAGQSPIKAIEEELKRIRISEYQTIGDDARRNQTNLYRLYDALTSRIIESIEA